MNPPSRRVRHARKLFAGVAREYDLMSEVLSYGANRRWRRFLVSRVEVPPGADVLDVATGTAGVAIELARRKRVRAIGLDQSMPMLRVGRGRVRRFALQDRIPLVSGRAERLPFRDGQFDAVTFTYLLRYIDDPPATLSEMARVLRPGGVLACLEFHIPENRFLRAGWWVQTRVGLPVLGVFASRAWYRAGRFLGPSISDFYRRYPLSEQARWWQAAGLANLRRRTMTFGTGVVVWGVKHDG